MVNGIMAESLAQALDIMSRGGYIPYAGGTDLMTAEEPGRNFLFLNRLGELKSLRDDGEYLRLGAGLTFAELCRSSLVPPLLRQAASQVGSPAIRNLGTIGGNIANGSPKADSALVFFATDSRLVLSHRDGTREIAVSDFYLGRKKTDLRPGELITEVLMPKCDYSFYYKKIGARKALAISRLSFAGIVRVGDDGTVERLATAFGAIDDVIVRRRDLDSMLEGAPLCEAKLHIPEYLRSYGEAINPIQGRISAEYRKDVCMNLLRDFLVFAGISS